MRSKNIDKREILLVFLCFVLFLILGSSGAVTALGNSLFPENSLIEGFSKDFSSTSHFLIRLRVIHPILAITTCSLFYLILVKWEEFSMPYISTSILQVSILFSLGFGALNVLLLAPVWSALVHLLIADLLWCTFIFRVLSRVFVIDLSFRQKASF